MAFLDVFSQVFGLTKPGPCHYRCKQNDAYGTAHRQKLYTKMGDGGVAFLVSATSEQTRFRMRGAIGGLSMDGKSWPHGFHGDAYPHGTVFRV